MVVQCHRVQVQRAVARPFFTEVIEQGRQGGQRDVLDLAGYQLQHVVMLLDLDQVAVIEFAQQQVLRDVEDVFDALGDELRAVVAETAHSQPGLLRPAGQAVEIVAQAIEQGMWAVVTADQHFVPAVERDLVQGQHQVFPDTCVAQGVGALGGHQDVQFAVVLERIDADVDQDQHLAGHAGVQQRLFSDGRQRQGNALLQAAQQVEQLEFAQVAAARVQGQAGAAVDHAVAVAPGEQLEQMAAALDWGEMFPLEHGQATVV
ncbi:hypothetical protein D3C76_786160 [compost metagenome]